MKNAWVLLLLGPLLMLLHNSRSRPAQQAIVNPAEIDEFITRQMITQQVPGLALAITQGDRVLYVKGYGTAGNGQPVTSQISFFIASVSKSFTALAVMQLVEAGKIDLDAPVQTYLSEFSLADPKVASQITVRNLLNQTSGLSELGFPDMQLPQPETIEERVTSLQTARPVDKPGTEYHYFSPNYGILAPLVEVVSGQSYSEYMDQNVFAPLAMNDSLSVVTSTEGMQKADRLAQGLLVAFGIPFFYSEARGYLGGRYKNEQLVTPESMYLIHNPPAKIKGDYAMGLIETTVGGKRILEHTGIISMYSADAILIPEDEIGISVFCNVSSCATNTFGAPQIGNGLISLLTGKQPESNWMDVRF